MMKILMQFRPPDEVADKYKGSFELECPPGDSGFSIGELIERLPGADAYLGGVLTREMIDSAKRLKIACSCGAGYENLDYKYAGEKGIWVMNAPTATTEPTAELTIAIMLCLTRRLFNYNNMMKKRGDAGGVAGFTEQIDSAPIPTPVHGKTIGIVGFGKIGRTVARMAKGLGMDILFYDTFMPPDDVMKMTGAAYAPFDELLRKSDYVTLHCMYTPENHHLMGAKQFGMMKPTAYFINAARGKLMDERALVDALNGRRILGAALDVYEFEPQVSPELLEMENVVLVPHIGTVTMEDRLKMIYESFEGVIACLNGGEVPTIVNREHYRAKP